MLAVVDIAAPQASQPKSALAQCVPDDHSFPNGRWRILFEYEQEIPRAGQSDACSHKGVRQCKRPFAAREQPAANPSHRKRRNEIEQNQDAHQIMIGYQFHRVLEEFKRIVPDNKIQDGNDVHGKKASQRHAKRSERRPHQLTPSERERITKCLVPIPTPRRLRT